MLANTVDGSFISIIVARINEKIPNGDVLKNIYN